MKKTGLFKIITFILLGIVLITWLFSASYFQNGELVELGMYQLGFFDFFQLLTSSFEFQYFLQILILLVSIGALYGVLNKTGKFRAWIERIVNNFRGAELIFLLMASFTIAGLNATLDLGLNLVIFFPLIISIILAMGYDKITAALATFGALLVGTIGNVSGYSTAFAIAEIVGNKVTDGIIFRIVLFVLSISVLFIFLARAKRTKIVNNEKEDMFLGEKESNKYSIAPIIVIFGLIFVIMIIGCTNWVDTFKVTAFEDLHKTITEFQVKLPKFTITSEGVKYGMEKIAIFGKLIGNINALGNWYYGEMSVIVFLAAMVIGLFYRIKLSNRFEYMADGAKKMFKPALMVVFAYAVIYYAGMTMFYPTIAKYILGITKNFNLVFSTITSMIGSFFHIDVLYLINYVIPQIAAQDVNGTIVALLTQGVFGTTMLIAPTSAVLVLGLTYLGIPYKEWIKRTWIFTLIQLAAVLVVVVASMLIL